MKSTVSSIKTFTEDLQLQIGFWASYKRSLRRSLAKPRQLLGHKVLKASLPNAETAFMEPGRRSGAWVKMRIGGGQEFVIGGYTPSSKNFDALLVGYYEGNALMFAAKIRNGFIPAVRQTVFQHFKKLRIKTCPFANLPECGKGRWGEGLTAADMDKCIWLKPQLVVAIEYAEWTPANHLRHSKFIALREDKNARDVIRENR